MNVKTEDSVDLLHRLIFSLHQFLVSIPPATFCYIIISLAPPVATFLYFWSLEYWIRLPFADRIWPWVVFVSAGYAILFPPELPGYLALMFGPGSVIHIIRAIELAYVLEVPKVKRLRRKRSSGGALYAWESFPPPLTISRGIWLIDLMTSIRAIGWSHGPKNRLPPSSLLLQSRVASNPRKRIEGTHDWRGRDMGKFLIEKGVQIILCYLWIDFYQSIIIRSSVWQSLARPTDWGHPEIQHKVLSWLLTPWVKWIPVKICIYSTIQLSCSLLAFVDVGLGLLGNEPWQYPPIFGSTIGVTKVNFQAIWGEWWHDLFRLTFLGIADWVIRSSKAGERWEDILVLSIPFLFYSAIHASLSYSVSHNALASALVVVFGAIQPLVILTQVKLRLSEHGRKKILYKLIGLSFLLTTFGLLLGNPGVLHSLASFPIPISVWRKGVPGVGNKVSSALMEGVQ